jgi:adenylate cyclase
MTWTLSPDLAIEERVTLVSIDERSLGRIGPWPWSREVMANLVNSINEAGAQLQIHDVVYPEGDKPGDVLFAAALANDERAIVAQLRVLQAQNELLQSGVLSHPLSGISCSRGQQNNSMPQALNYIGASETLVNIPKGHIAPVIDRDGSIRKAPAVICVADQPYPALSLAPFFHITNSSEWGARIIEEGGFFKPSQTLQIESYPGLAIPLDSDGNLRISFRKSPSSFRSVSAIDVLDGSYDPEMFDNVWILLGATAFGLDDLVPTPYSGISPGVELQARMLTSILDSDVPYAPNGRSSVLAALSLLIGALLFYTASRRGRFALAGLPLIIRSVERSGSAHCRACQGKV